jgi:type II secretory pathway component PulF
MMRAINIYFAKSAFMEDRGEIYQLLEANFSETGSGKQSKARDLFDSWAARSASRSENIALAHRSIVKRLDSGLSFSQSINPFIPKEEAMILEAGEASGKIVQALVSVQHQRKATAEIKSLVGAAVAEPAMSVVSIALTSWFCGSSLWPEMLKVVEEKYWPGWALPLVNFEIALAHHWQIAGLLIFVAWLYWWSIPRWRGHIRAIFDHVPPWSIYRDRQAATFLGVLGGLLGSGMELDAALARIQTKSEPWLEWHIHQIRKKLAVVGANPMQAMDTGLFSTKLLDLIEDASRNRSFDVALSHLGTDALPIIVQRVKTMATFTGMVLSLITGVFFIYQVAVQQSGVTQATNNYMAVQSK